KAMALTGLAKYDDAKAAITSARSNLTHATASSASKLDDLELEISLVQEKLSETGGDDALERYDALYRNHLTAERWQDAVKNRSESALLANQLGRTDLFRQ